METKETDFKSSNKSKRTLSEESEPDKFNKKSKNFSVSEFRNNLKDGDRLQALQDFLKLIQNESKKYGAILSYLDSGGSCLELIQILEIDSTISPVIVFEIITYILLKITISNSYYHSAANEACRYLLHNYVTVINKMIGLSSTTPERKVCLKLLTAIVTFSSSFAKDVLINVNFHSTTVELLTKHTGEKNSVRDNFIHFITAFFVDGHYPALSVLLDKKGFITSIISGLQYDDSDTLCIVISAMRRYILENPAVSKTSKMKTFNTMVVKEIVNLYNWKGPSAQKGKSKEQVTVNIDPLEKSKVNECVHEFLLVLCTSHKFGVIFRDPLVGLGKKNQNPLMYTVLESLDRPWDHSYASDLVIKICGACPDLAKHVWNNLKPFLEPRDTQKWINAINFTKKLIQELQPASINHCIKELNVYQVFQVIQCLVAPAPVVKAVIPDLSNPNSSIKQYITSVYLEILQSLNIYMKESKKYFVSKEYEKLTSLIRTYVKNNFPDPMNVFEGFKIIEPSEIDESDYISLQTYIETILDVLNTYKQLSPLLLESLNSIEIVDVIVKINNIFENNIEILPKIQLKVINIFIDIDQTKFSVKSDLFSFVIPLLFKFFYETQSREALSVLRKLFINTRIFDGCEYEINIWINGIFNLKRFDDSVVDIIITTLKTTDENASDFFNRLSLKSDVRVNNISEIINNLKSIDIDYHKHIYIKNRYLSPMIVGLFTTLQETELKKNMKMYVDFVVMNLIHLQSDIDVIADILKDNDSCNANIKDYVTSWQHCTAISSFSKIAGRMKIFPEYSEAFLFNDIESMMKNGDFKSYPDLPINLLIMSLFYLTNMLKNNVLTSVVIENCEKFLKFSIEKRDVDDMFLEILLCQPVFVQNISFTSLHKEKSQKYGIQFLVNIIKCLLNNGFEIEKYLIVYQEKLANSVLKILENYKNYNNLNQFSEILELFKIDYVACCRIISYFSKIIDNLSEHSPIVLDILTYSVKQISISCKNNFNLKPLASDLFQDLIKYFIHLNEMEDIDTAQFCSVFLEYLEIFPHYLETYHQHLFTSILKASKFNTHMVKIAKLLLEKDIKYMECVEENVDMVCEKKPILLPILDVLVEKKVNKELLEKIYNKFEPSLNKALQKPQKAGQHFHNSYKGLTFLIETCMSLQKCEVYFQKVQKYEVSEVFHATLLGTIYRKSLPNLNDKQVNNIILTFVHLQMNLLKRNLKNENDDIKLENIANIFLDILNKLKEFNSTSDLKNTATNETVKLYFKFCLKYGLSGKIILLRALNNLLKLLVGQINSEDAKLLMDMLLSHSEFLDKMLNEHSDAKLEILSLFKTLCETWENLMEKSHVPVLLACYRAMVNKCDRTTLKILKRYEAKADQTHFFDYKPFLWGNAAAAHYSIRHNMENALLRQPKMGDILDILQDDIVISTIVNYPMNENLHLDDSELVKTEEIKSYDIKFLMPLFSQILAQEQQVQTYKFTRSGALSLTVLALSSQNEEVRRAACHIMSRFYFHLEAKHSGKDNLLWVRFVEAVCKGTAILPNFKLNSFSATYLSKMALVLTQPNHVMYLPLSQHLMAKASLDFSTIPELYTFLHSSDVNFREHRHFILELMRDGLRTEKDFTDFERSMAFKLFTELYSSCLSDVETKLLILSIIEAACKLPIGVKMLCENHSLLAIIYNDVNNISNNFGKQNQFILDKIVVILLKILNVLQNLHSNFMVLTILKLMSSVKIFSALSDHSKKVFFEIFNFIYNRFPELITKDDINVLLNISNDSLSQYINEYCSRNDVINCVDKDNKFYFLRLLVSKYKM